VSFRRLADALRAEHPDVDQKELFINRTLWSSNDERIFFSVRGDFERPAGRLDVPLTVRADGSDLRPLAMHLVGHVDWESDRCLIGAGGSQVLYDVVAQQVTGPLGGPGVFPRPGGDIALSPDGAWFVNGHGAGGKNYYPILRRGDAAWTRTSGLDQGGYTSGELRIDPSPCWNREGTRILVVAVDARHTRQIRLITENAPGRP
jgi:hypothetical protein